MNGVAASLRSRFVELEYFGTQEPFLHFFVGNVSTSG